MMQATDDAAAPSVALCCVGWRKGASMVKPWTTVIVAVVITLGLLYVIHVTPASNVPVLSDL
jgi:hypothetical protein